MLFRSINNGTQRRMFGDQCQSPIATARVSSGRAAYSLDGHGQELNRRNLHDPALSLAQVEPRPRGDAVARRQTKGLENGIPDWKSVSLVRRARKYPRAPHAGLPRRRSHAFATSASREWNITSCTCRAWQARTMRAAPIKRNARSHAVGEERSSPSRIGLDLVWKNPN